MQGWKRKCTFRFDVCENVRFDFGERRFVDHGCRVNRGSSGSPMWFYDRARQFRELRAVHTSALQLTSSPTDHRAPLPQAIILSGAVLEEIHEWIDVLPCQL